MIPRFINAFFDRFLKNIPLIQYFFQHSHPIEGEGEIIAVCEILRHGNHFLRQLYAGLLSLFSGHIRTVSRQHFVRRTLSALSFVDMGWVRKNVAPASIFFFTLPISTSRFRLP